MSVKDLLGVNHQEEIREGGKQNDRRKNALPQI